jgi:hypothetical protein
MKNSENIKRTEEYTENTACCYRLPNTSTMENLSMKVCAGAARVRMWWAAARLIGCVMVEASLIQRRFKACAFFLSVEFCPRMGVSIVVFPGSGEDINDPLLFVVHPRVDPHAGRVEVEAGVELVQRVLVFETRVRPDRQGRAVAQGESLQAPLDVVELVSLFALHDGVLLGRCSVPFGMCIYHSGTKK